MCLLNQEGCGVMANDKNPSALYLQIDPQAELQPDELDEVVRRLRSDLAELDVQSVDLVRDGQVPAGAKSAEAVTLGSLAVVLLPSVLPKVVEFLQTWFLRGENRRVKLKLQVRDNSVEVEYAPGATSASDVERLVAKLTGAMSKPAVTRKKKVVLPRPAVDLSAAVPRRPQ
jgi:hypothetical protein